MHFQRRGLGGRRALDVSVGDDTHHPVLVIDHGQAADLVFLEQVAALQQGRVGLDGNDVGSHPVFYEHGSSC